MILTLAVLIAASFGGCTPEDARTAFLLFLPASFGWKLYKLYKQRRAPKYVFQLPSGQDAMLTDDQARSKNRWRRWLRKPGTWERRPSEAIAADAPEGSAVARRRRRR